MDYISKIEGHPLKADSLTESAIDEVNTKLTLVKTATGNPCTFDTDLADNLVSLTAEIVASGGGGTPSTPIPIVGYSSANITRCGVNLFDKTNVADGYIDDSNGQVSGGAYYKHTDYIPVVGGQKIYIMTEQTSAKWGAWYDKNKNYISGITNYTQTEVTAPNNACYIRLTCCTSDTGNLDTFGVNYPSSDTAYHAYNGQTYTIAFGQTVYGGVLDVTRGKLHVTWGSVDLGSLSWTYITSGTIPRFQATLSPNAKALEDNTKIVSAICDIYGINSWSNVTNVSTYDDTLAANAGGNVITVHDSSYTDATAYTNAMNGIMLAYELATPFDIDLTPVQISALVGTNNITSDVGGDVEVRYMAGEVASQVADIVKTELPDKPKYVLNEEKIVGYWIDGKPIYEKLLSQTFSSGSDVVAIGLPYRTYAVLDAWGFLMYQDLSNSVLINGCLDATQSVYAIFNRAENDGILIKRESSSMGGSTPTVYVTVRYIKS